MIIIIIWFGDNVTMNWSPLQNEIRTQKCETASYVSFTNYFHTLSCRGFSIWHSLIHTPECASMPWTTTSCLDNNVMPWTSTSCPGHQRHATTTTSCPGHQRHALDITAMPWTSTSCPGHQRHAPTTTSCPGHQRHARQQRQQRWIYSLLPKTQWMSLMSYPGLIIWNTRHVWYVVKCLIE